MDIITGNLLNIKEGVIVHQVNCQNRIGAGLSGQLIKKYPVVQTAYTEYCNKTKPKNRLGCIQPVPVTKKLTIINLFTQFYYGNAAKTHQIYTDVPLLVEKLQLICSKFPEKPIYIPYKIGCGLAGADWENDVYPKIKNLPIIAVKL